jgi:hypothetical protein
MDRNDQHAIDQLFGKLREIEQRSPARDREAEGLIREYLARQPGAPYYMAQAVLALEQALATAQQRLEEAESRGSGGGFLGEIFGTGRGARTGQQPRQRALRAQDPLQQDAGPWGRQPSFLGGAMQTALGVAGGVVLGSFLADLMMPDPAMANTGDAGAAEGYDASAEDAGGDFGGGDFGGGDFGGME